MAAVTEHAPPAIPITAKDQQEMLDIYQKIRTSEAKLIGSDGKAEILPASLYSFLCNILGPLKDGRSVTILQSNASLTTTEAAKLLGVSRQHLIKLLHNGEIPHHFVGTHRRVYARDVFAYRAKRDTARRKSLDDLARAEYNEGIYGRMPDDLKSQQ
jgi:excisionase family DNA binding protein